jgi:diguanylate cyclase (GGDEF)-like protein
VSQDDARASTTDAAPRRHLYWVAACAVLVLVGVAASLLAAGAVRDHQTEEARQAFEHRSAAVASTLQLAIQHENDVLVDAGGMIATGDRSPGAFQQWAAASRVLDRYPEIGGIGVLELVRESELSDFTAELESDPATATGAPFEVLPPGDRSFYCFITASISDGRAVAVPRGVDYCASAVVGAPLLDTRDSGLGLYAPYESGGRTWLGIETPVYRGGEVPETVPGRRAACAGWVATQLDPTVLLERAVRDEPGMAVTLSYQDDSTSARFPYRAAESDADSQTVELGDGWTVQTSAVVEAGSVLDGEALLLLISGSAVSVLLGLLVWVLGTGRERARRQVEDRTRELHHQALHDALTGLPNRALVLDRAEQMLDRHRRNQSGGAALFLDLDDFKNVNDTLGHGAGDHLLVGVAQRLSSVLRGGDTIGRMGGDEFVVLLDGTAADIAPELVAERLIEVLNQPFELPECALPITVNVSIGIAVGDRESAGALLRDADVALYQAKAAGKNCFAVFDPEMDSESARRSDLEFELRSALAGEQYRLVYQPIYRLDDLSMVGVEALLRWAHPVRGVVAPDEFIPILEQTGRITEVGRWVLHEACRQGAAWRARGDQIDISVNVSARQLEHDGVIDDIREALQLSGLPSTALVIEVTESALMRNVDDVAARLTAIKELGVRVAVDDFGTGYSSLAYLRRFPVDCLKIDRTFTSSVDTTPQSKALVDTLVQLGRDLGLYTVAEGLETPGEMATLRGAEVDQAQGFLMARPLAPDVLESELLAPQRAAVGAAPH